MRAFAERKYDIIVGIGFAQAPILDSVAKDYPEIQFAIVDGVSELPNVASLVFKEHEGSYLVGILAAMTTRTGTLGFLGGMDIGLIHRFGKGYEEGARSVNPNIRVLENYVGVTDAAWNNPGRGKELALAQIAKGADVIFHCRRQFWPGRVRRRRGKRPRCQRPRHALRHRRRLQPEHGEAGLRAHEHDQARGQRRVPDRQGRHREALHARASRLRPRERRRRLRRRRVQQVLLSPEAITAAEDAKRKIIAGEIKVTDAMFQ